MDSQHTLNSQNNPTEQSQRSHSHDFTTYYKAIIIKKVCCQQKEMYTNGINQRIQKYAVIQEIKKGAKNGAENNKKRIINKWFGESGYLYV